MRAAPVGLVQKTRETGKDPQASQVPLGHHTFLSQSTGFEGCRHRPEGVAVQRLLIRFSNGAGGGSLGGCLSNCKHQGANISRLKVPAEHHGALGTTSYGNQLGSSTGLFGSKFGTVPSYIFALTKMMAGRMLILGLS